VNPLWPAFGEALVRGDFEWARLALRRAIVGITLVGAVAGSTLLLVSAPLVHYWTATKYEHTELLRLGFSVWVVLAGYIAVMNSFLNQRGVMESHLKVFGSAAILSLALKVLLIGR